MRGGSEAGDAETLLRFRASLHEKEAEREGFRLLSTAYGEAEDRGADPWWGRPDFAELAGSLSPDRPLVAPKVAGSSPERVGR